MKKITKKQLGFLHGLLNSLELMDYKPDMIRSITNSRTTSAKELSSDEAATMIDSLKRQKNIKFSPMRKKIIHQCCMMGMVKEEDKPDYPRINRYVKNIGSRNPKQKELNQLNWQELIEVTTQIETVYTKFLKR